MLAVPLIEDAQACTLTPHILESTDSSPFFHCLDFAVLGVDLRGSCMLRKDNARVNLPSPSNVQGVSCALLLRH